MNSAYLLIGSNIDPVENTIRAISLLRRMVEIKKASSTWETPSIGSPGPNYINIAIKVLTEMDRTSLKEKAINPIEQTLGRVRGEDKNAPRTIDIDILVFNDEVVEPHLWMRPYEALPLADLLPKLVHPETGKMLSGIAHDMLASSRASIHRELHFL